MIHYVLAAPGSGKTAVAPFLRSLLPGSVVLDWDAFMDPAEALAGVAISETPEIWAKYGQLVRVIVEQVLPVNIVMLGVCTPGQLRGWPDGRWLLLDCADAERRTRLSRRGHPTVTEEAITDAGVYRSLGLPIVDSTDLEPHKVAEAIVTAMSAVFARGEPLSARRSGCSEGVHGDVTINE